MKKIAILALIVIQSISVFGQWEYTYFALKLGASHFFLSPQQNTASNLVLRNQNGNFEQLFTSKELGINVKPDYLAQPLIELQLHYDFTNERQGIVFGVNYSPITLSQSFYVENSNKAILRRDISLQSINFPLFLKFGKRIFDQQQYFFAGAELTLNRGITVKESVSWSPQVYKRKGVVDEYSTENFVLFAGFNYLIFNIQLNYLPKNFLNKHYVNDQAQPIYSLQKDDILFLNTSLVFPFTAWLSTKSYWLYRLKRNFTRR